MTFLTKILYPHKFYKNFCFNENVFFNKHLFFDENFSATEKIWVKNVQKLHDEKLKEPPGCSIIRGRTNKANKQAMYISLVLSAIYYPCG